MIKFFGDERATNEFSNLSKTFYAGYRYTKKREKLFENGEREKHNCSIGI